MHASWIELELKRALSAGDRKRAASLLVAHYADDVLAVCRAMLRDRTLAEDLVQETFGRAIVGLASFRGESSPRTWLLSIARNGCLDVLRRQRASPIDDDGEPDGYAEPAPAALDRLVRREDVERALAPLGETERALVVLHYGHGVGYAELGEAFALREGAVRMRMSRAVEKMRAALASDPVRSAMPARARAAPAPMVPRAPSAAPRGAGAPAPQGGPPVAAPALAPLREQVSAELRTRLAALAAAA